MVDLFWPGLLVMVVAAVAIGVSHQLNERRWRREREAERAAGHSAE